MKRALEEPSTFMSLVVRSRYFWALTSLFMVFLFCAWIHVSYQDKSLSMPGKQIQVNNKYARITPPFSNRFATTFGAIMYQCLKGFQPKTVEDLPPLVSILKQNKKYKCQKHYQLFKSIFQIRLKETSIVISDTFMSKVKKWMNDNKKLIEATKHQQLIFVDNLWTLESTVYNPVRAKRPGGNSAGDKTKNYVYKLAKDTKDGCDFCNYKQYTASDAFGIRESNLSVVVSNTFKIEKYHGMVLFKKHRPVDFTQDEFIDAIDLSMSWFKITHALVPNYKYRFMYMDLLPKASASQVHPHIHLTVGDYAYYSRWNVLHQSSQRFSSEFTNKNYWTSLLEVHNSLGLIASFGRASVMAYVTPHKDFEVIVISRKPCLDFFRLVFFTTRTLMDDMNQYALSFGYVFPKLDTDSRNGDELPMIARIVSRGSPELARSDISSFDLFGTPNVNKDPFVVIQSIQNSLNNKWRYSKLSFTPKNLK